MSRARLLTALLVGAFAASPLTAQSAHPRVIVLGFDGVDHGLTERYMKDGKLPHLQALAEKGTFSRLETTNPAESAVSWSTFDRGLDSGHTEMFGFVARKPGTYLPELQFMKMGSAPLEQFYDPPKRVSWLAIAVGAVIGAVPGLLLLHGRARMIGTGVLALVGAGAGALVGGGPAAPARVPTLESVAHGKPLWQRLDEAGIRTKGLLVPMAAPIEPLAHGEMIGGLGVPDALGNAVGSYTLFSSSASDVPRGDTRTTASSGLVVRLKKDGDGWRAKLPGPPDMARKLEVEDRLAKIAEHLQDGGVTGSARNDLLGEQKQLMDESRKGFATALDVHVARASAEKTLQVTIGDQSATVAEGDWSGWLPLKFGLPWPLDAAALCRFRVLEAGDDVRLFFAPLGYDPRETPKHMQMEQPSGFGAEVTKDAGLFDTTGWACISNPLKDTEIDEGTFLQHIRLLTAERSKMLYSELGKKDFDFFFAMFGETDRVQHMMFRLIDEKSPLYDAELAKKYGDAILKVYQAMDEIVGQVMDRFVDDDTILLVVSDHGFNSFRRQVNLNTWLMKEGYLVPKRDTSDPTELLSRLRGIDRDYLLYMDPARSKAFSLGLGKIYINLKGRESQGIVPKEDLDALCKEITDKLLALRDPQDGAKAINRVWRSDELYHGPYANEDAELTVGFAEHYRVSWATTTGGFDAEVFEDNDSKWSGGHASNDPAIVPGVLFSNRRIAPDQRPAVVDMAPTILALYGIQQDPTDGRVVTFQ